MAKTPTIQLPDLMADQTRPESIAMVAVAAWGVGFVVMFGVARLAPHETSGAKAAGAGQVVQAARAQLPGTGAAPNRAVSTTRGLGAPDETPIVSPAPAVEVVAQLTPVLAKPAPATELIAQPAPVLPTAAAEAIAQPTPVLATAAPAAEKIAQPAPVLTTEAPVPGSDVAVAVKDHVNVNVTERDRGQAAKPVRTIDAPANVPAPTSAAVGEPLPATPAIAIAPPTAAPQRSPLPAASTGDPSAANAATIVAKKRATKRELTRGVLAYLRCEGSERPHARFPCPRDPKLEEQVWHALEALPMCDSDPGTGTAELRMELRKSQIQSIEWKPIGAAPGLNLRAVGKCAGTKLAGLTTRLKAPEGLVSFRFSLE